MGFKRHPWPEHRSCLAFFVKFMVPYEAPAQGVGLLTVFGAGTHSNLLISAWRWADGHRGKCEDMWGGAHLQQTMKLLRNKGKNTGARGKGQLRPSHWVLTCLKKAVSD